MMGSTHVYVEHWKDSSIASGARKVCTKPILGWVPLRFVDIELIYNTAKDQPEHEAGKVNAFSALFLIVLNTSLPIFTCPIQIVRNFSS